MPKTAIKKSSHRFDRLNTLSIELEELLFPNKEDFKQVQLENHAFAQNTGNKISQQYEDYLDSLLTNNEPKNNKELIKDTHYNYAIHLISLRYYYDACSELVNTLDEKTKFLHYARDYSIQGIYHMENALTLSDTLVEKQLIEPFLNQYRERLEAIEIELNQINQSSEQRRKLSPRLFVNTQETSVLGEESMTPRQISPNEYVDDIIYLARQTTRLSPTNKSLLPALSLFHGKPLTEESVPVKKRCYFSGSKDDTSESLNIQSTALNIT